jgi:hypothetical protein
MSWSTFGWAVLGLVIGALVLVTPMFVAWLVKSTRRAWRNEPKWWRGWRPEDDE